MHATSTMSPAVQPRERSFIGFASPWSTGPSAENGIHEVLKIDTCLGGQKRTQCCAAVGAGIGGKCHDASIIEANFLHVADELILLQMPLVSDYLEAERTAGDIAALDSDHEVTRPLGIRRCSGGAETFQISL